MAELERLHMQRRTVPTDAPESDGTLAWDSTTAVIVELAADGVSGMGWTYADGAAAAIVESKLAPALRGCDLDCIGACWLAMRLPKRPRLSRRRSLPRAERPRRPGGDAVARRVDGEVSRACP
jgi:hypothetical protein